MLAKEIANLTPRQRALLEERLKARRRPQQQQPIACRAAEGIPQPASPAQERLWFLDRLTGAGPAYNLPGAVRPGTTLRPDWLGTALAEVVARHAALRTRFVEHEGEPQQLVEPAVGNAAARLPVIDLRALQAAAAGREGRRLSAIEAGRPFDLECGPLLRVRLLRLAADDDAVLFNLHHIIADDWSLQVLQREVMALYQARANGSSAGLGAVPLQYPDYTLWLREELAGGLLERQLTYWRERLNGLAESVDLPTDRPRAALRQVAGEVVEVIASGGRARAVRQLARAQAATPFMVLMAAFQALLGRLSGQSEVAVGTTVAGRDRVETEAAIGCYANTLVIRAGVDPEQSFAAYLEQQKEAMLEDLGHRDLPFERLVEDLALRRSLDRTPLFQVLFTLQNATQAVAAVGPEQAHRQLGVATGGAKFDLTLALVDDGEALRGEVELASALYDRSTVGRWIESLWTLLEAAAERPETALGELPWLTAGARQQLLVEWNDTGEHFAHAGLLHRLVAEQAERAPSALAVSFEERRWSYGELAEQVARRADWLAGHGVGRGGLVGVAIERSLELPALLLAVLELGAAYVPLDPEQPPQRLAGIIDDHRLPWVLVRRQLDQSLPATAAERLIAEPGVELPAGELEGRAPGFRASGAEQASPDDLAYVIFTSGSTGRPKGVMNSHRAICNRLAWMQRQYQLGSADRVLQKTPLSFDVSVWELFWPLATGAGLVMARPGGHREPAYLARTLDHRQITTVHFVPSMLRAFLDGVAPAELAALRGRLRVIASGEALTSELAERVEAGLGSELYNLYGPTEAAVDVSYWPCRRGTGDGGVPIGRPISNLGLWVVDPRLREQPIGVHGELLIGGVGLALGYLGRPALTAAVFVPDPFASVAGQRLYRTGDLVRQLADGALEYLGRLDHQVKLRGLRIELGEIEAALGAHPGVAQAVVVLADDLPTGPGLVAYLVAARQPAPTFEELRAYLAERLPLQMVPAVWLALDSLPTTTSGKIDRRALPPVSAAATGAAGAASRPAEGPLEELLAGVWSEVLGTTVTDVEADFFALGGHSLLATRVVAKLRDLVAVELPVAALFEAPTIASLAQRIELAKRGGAGVVRPALEVVPRPARLPLSFAQERLWFLDRLQAGDSAYNLPMVSRIEGPLEVAALAAALDQLHYRHEILRTVFPASQGQAEQRIEAPTRRPLPVVDLSGLPETAAHLAARRLSRWSARRSFDLEHGPLTRACLLRLAAADHLLLLELHHILADEWSFDVLRGELLELYQACLGGRSTGASPALSPLPELPVQYADYALWQRRWLRGEALERQLLPWRERLRDLPQLELPTDRPRPALVTYRGASLARVLPASVGEGLERLGRDHGVTPFMTSLAAFSLLLGRYAGQRDVVLGTPIANRDQGATENLIGLLLNTLVLRLGWAAGESFSDLLRGARQVALEAYTHQDLPFEVLVEELEPERRLDRSPLFQVMLLYRTRRLPSEAASAASAAASSLRLSTVEADTGSAKFDLTLALRESADTLVAAVDYNVDLFDHTTVHRLLDHFVVLLEAALAAPASSLAELPMLSAGEAHQLSVELNDSAVERHGESFLPQLLERQIERCGAAPAVIFEGTELSYDDFGRRVVALAAELRRRGLGADGRVGVLLERGFEMVIALHATVWAGGAFVPLEPDYPDERLAFLVEDAGIELVLSVKRLADRPLGVAVLCLDDELPAAAPGPAPIVAEQLAYVIYTSGSTGQPKGAMNSHLGLRNRVLWMQETYPLSTADRVLQKTPFSFDVSVWEFFWPLVCGATLVVARPDGHREPAYLARLIDQQKVTTLHFVPSMLRAFLAGAEPDALSRCAATLRRVIASGEALTAELVERFHTHLPTELHNLYGPTEAAIDVTAWPCRADGSPGPVPIGRPIANLVIEILDRSARPVSLGVAGELMIGGDGLARGYVGRPALSAERFVPADSSSLPEGARWYRSGDLARWRSDGAIEFLRRLDHQVKIHGLRIEPGEVESTLLRHPAVDACAVMARQDGGPGQGARLVAYVVAAGEAAAESAELKAFLAERLPAHLVPVLFVPLAALPLTTSGKVDRRALPAPTLGSGLAERPYSPPRSVEERQLAEVWRRVLGLDRVGVEDNFFELGGDSILSIQVVARAAEAGLRVTPRQMFENQTLAGLATVATAAVPRRRSARPASGELPLTPIQRWYLESQPSVAAHFNQSLLLALAEPLAPARLRRAVAALIEHHDGLRLRFSRRPATAGEPGGWTQRYEPVAEVAASTVDLDALAAEDARRAMAAVATRVQTSLDLEQGPLLRATLLRLPAAEGQRLLLVAHHLVMDGVSWRIALADLELAYRRAESVAEAVAALPAKTDSFKDWAEALVELAQGTDLAAEAEFWLDPRRQSVAPLPLDRPAADAGRVGAERSVSSALDAVATDALLTRAAAAYHARPEDLLLTALALACGAWSGGDRLLVDLEGHGREEVGDLDTSRTVGWFTCLYPVLLELAAGTAPGAAIRAIKEQLRAVPRRGLGYGLLRYLGGGETAEQLARLAESQVLFNYLGRLDRAVDESSTFLAAAESSGPPRSPQQRRSHLLEVNMSVVGDRLQTVWVYSPAVHDRSTIESLASAFTEVLKGLVEHCLLPAAGGYTPSDFPLAALAPEPLAELEDRFPELIDLYPLSPLQEGLLFHGLEAVGDGLYIEQLSCRLRGALDSAAFEAAWQALVERQPMLRTAFVWEGVERPLQAVLRRVPAALEQLDWRQQPAAAHDRLLAELAEVERQRPLDLDRPPLMRLLLVRLTEDGYGLVWTHHHLILDGWSVAQLIGEFFALYGALGQGRQPPPSALRPFRDYIGWLVRQDLAAAESFWRSELAGFVNATPVPAPLPEAALGGTAAELQAVLPEAVAGPLRRWAQRHQLTLASLIEGAWAVLLGRYSGQLDVVFGLVSSGRPSQLQGVESMIGMFINTLPVRARWQESDGLIDWLQALQARQAEARQFDFAPLPRVQGWSELPAGQALFDSLVIFENFPVAESAESAAGEDQPLVIEQAEFHERTNYALTLIAAPGAEIPLRLLYDAERYDAASAGRLLGHFRGLLEGFAGTSAGRLGELELLSTAERRQLLVEWNVAREPDPEVDREIGCETTLQEMFFARAARQPERPAVAAGNERWSYAELAQRVTARAAELRSLGVGPEVLVAVCVRRRAALVEALLAVLEAGGAYVAIDPDYPAARQEMVLRDAAAPVLIADGDVLDQLPPHEAEIVRLDRPPIAGRPTAAGRAAAGNLAYVLYTSGSTGRPKAVGIEQRSAVALVRWALDEYSAEELAGVLGSTSICFDLSVFEIFVPLAAGGCLLLADNAPQLAELAAADEVTLINTVPSAINELLRLDGIPSSVRVINLAGEPLRGELVERLYAGTRAKRVMDLYGPSEDTTYSTFAVAPRGADREPTIGRSIRASQAYVLDRVLRPVPVGVAAELCLGGAGLARGYLGRPALTAASFVPDPFAEQPGQRLYRTGDLARWWSDGMLDFLGRFDHQVKVRGYRIELGEIETALGRLPGMRECVVVARYDGPGEGQRLVAYLVVDGSMPSAAELRRQLRQSLPDYMVPAVFVELSALPLTPNGKVDRRQLPAPGAAVVGERAFEAPRNDLEQQLAAIWSEVLQVPRIGIADNFLELGGDSILSLQVVSKAARLGLRMTPRQVFAHPTLAELAAVIEEAPAVLAEQGAVRGEARLTPAQRWFFDQQMADPQHFNQSFMLSLAEPLEAGYLRRATTALMRHHDALRLRFEPPASAAELRRQQHAEPPADGAGLMLEVDLTALPAAAAKAAVEQAAEQLQRGFDLGHGPLLRLALFRLGDDQDGDVQRLLLVAHHLVIDGVSWRVVLEDLQTAYRQLATGEALELPPKTTSFQAWGEALAEHAGSSATGGELDYWLAEPRLQVEPLPQDGPAVGAGSVVAGSVVAGSVEASRVVTVELAGNLTEALLGPAQRPYRARIDDLLLTALAWAFERWTGQPRLLVDFEGHGREALDGVDVSRTVGWFTSIYPVLIELAEKADPGRQLMQVKEQLRAVPQYGLGYGGLRYLGSQEQAARLAEAPQAEVLFNYLGQLDRGLREDSPLRPAAESAGAERSSKQQRRYPLEINAAVGNGRLRATLAYHPQAHSRQLIETLADDWMVALETLIGHCLAPGAGGYTPSDFPTVELGDDLLARAVAGIGAGAAELRVESLHELTEPQLGMLYESLGAPGSGVHVEQWSCVLRGELEPAAFAESWQRVIERHSVLRTGFVWDEQPQPLQLELDRAPLEIVWRDWRALGPEIPDAELERFLSADRRRGFELDRPPLMRLTLLRTAADALRMVWTHHHILMDGWCRPLVLQEVLQTYAGLLTGDLVELPAVRAYGDYLSWLRRQDVAAAEVYWRELLEGFSEPNLPGRELPTEAPAATGDRDRYRHHQGALDRERSAVLQQLARRHRLTLNTFVQGAWALLLSRYSERRDVLFGVTVAGRPTELAGIEHTIGLFINTLPLRLQVQPEDDLPTWLGEILDANLALRRYEHVAGGRVRQWAEVVPALPLFESLLVFENYPLGPADESPPDGSEPASASALPLRIEGVLGEGARTQFPLVILAEPEQRLGVQVVVDGERFAPGAGRQVLDDLLRLLADFADRPETRLADLVAPGSTAGATTVPSLWLRRRALPAVTSAQPRGDLENRLAEVWQEVLGVEQVGREDSFFELGGHSLLAAELVRRLSERLGRPVGLADLLARPTIAGLAVALEGSEGSDAPLALSFVRDLALPEIEHDPAARFEPFPLTDIQHAYWLGREAAFQLGNISTHLYSEADFKSLDIERLNRAWSRLVERHDMLRAVVLPNGDQRVLETVPEYRFPRLDLSAVDGEARERALLSVRLEMSHQVIPADRWPLFEIRVSELAAGAVRLHISFDLLIGDGFSYDLLSSELMQLYFHPQLELRPLEITFRDYVLAEQGLGESELFSAAESYWQGRLDSLPAAPDLPLAALPAELEQPRFARRRSTLETAAWERFSSLAQGRGLTPSAVLLTAFGEVLARWSKSPRFTLNLTLFNRLPLHPQVFEIVGDFTSLTLLQMDMGVEASFTDRAHQVQQQLWNDLENRYYSGVRVQRDLARQRGGLAGAMMPVVFTSALAQEGAGGQQPAEETAPPAAPAEDQEILELDNVFSISQTPQVWLDHQVAMRSDGGIDFWWDHVEELFPEGVVDAMFDAFEELLGRLSSREESWLDRFPVRLPDTQAAIYQQVNDTAAERPTGLLHQGFFEQAAECPDRIALITAEHSLSYGALAIHAHGLGARLRRLGAAPERLVAVVMEKGWEQVVAVLAVLEAGAAYLPIDANLPAERVAYLLDQAEVEQVVAQPWVAARIEWPDKVEVLTVEPALPSPEQVVAERVAPVAADQLAYVIFTSGSTGLPKGVMIEHQAALNTVVDVNQRFAVTPEDRVLGLSALSFDLSVYDIFGPLAVGAALVLPSASARRDPAHWLQVIDRQRISLWNSVPQLAQMLVDYLPASAIGRLAGLRVVMMSGDWLPVSLPDRLRRQTAGVEVVSMGGATEASIWSILYPVDEVDPSWPSIPYGRPMVNQAFHVLDGDLEPRPWWVPGQLYIGGIGLARGYWRDGDKTAASFFDHPRSGQRLYATGDLGRYLPSGDIEFLGREDLQVKVQGYRVELGEIEATLEQHPEVRAAVVSAVGEDRSHRRLLAYVVADAVAADGTAAALQPVPPVAPPPLPSLVAGVLDAAALRRLRDARPGLRRDDGERLWSAPPLVVGDLGSDLAAHDAGLGLGRQLPAEESAPPPDGALLGDWLGVLRQISLDDVALPKYRYPSAGNLYPVQTYLVLAEHAVDGVAAGIYYYHPKSDQLVAAKAGLPAVDEALALAARRAESVPRWALFLVARQTAMAPVYGPATADFCRLEAGYMAQLLLAEAGRLGLALDLREALDEKRLGSLLELAIGDQPLLALAGGAVDTDPLPRPAPAAALGQLGELAELADELARLEHKLAEPGLRHDLDDRPRLRLPGDRPAETFAVSCRRRVSHRQFPEPTTVVALAGLLAALKLDAAQSGATLPGRYASPGAVYGVQTYLQVRAGGVAGLAGGFYYYEPAGGRWVQLAEDGAWSVEVHDPINRSVAAAASFALYLVAPLAELQPLYGEAARDRTLLEAGAMGQLLMERAADVGLGLCPVGSLEFASLAPALDLAAGAELLHSFLGGAVRSSASVAEELPGDGLDERLRAYLGERLPAYMVPAAVRVLDSLPLSANGKVDRQALPAVDDPAALSEAPFLAPRDANEELVAGLWSELLAVERIGVHDNFFGVGGDSVKGIQLLTRLREAGYDLTPRQLFENPTVAELASVAARHRLDRSLTDDPPVADPAAALPAAGQGGATAVELSDADLDEDDFDDLLAELGGDED